MADGLKEERIQVELCRGLRCPFKVALSYGGVMVGDSRAVVEYYV